MSKVWAFGSPLCCILQEKLVPRERFHCNLYGFPRPITQGRPGLVPGFREYSILASAAEAQAALEQCACLCALRAVLVAASQRVCAQSKRTHCAACLCRAPARKPECQKQGIGFASFGFKVWLRLCLGLVHM